MDSQSYDVKELMKKIEELRRSGGVDLSTEEDLSIAIMNLISLEEHFFFSWVKTAKDQYFDWLGEVREMRKKLLARMIDRHEGETWCIAKHLLAATMRLMEVGTKLHAEGKKEEARETFSQAEKLYTLFWGLRLKLINTSDLKHEAASPVRSHATGTLDVSSEKTSNGASESSGQVQDKPWTLKEIVDKLVDCCDE